MWPFVATRIMPSTLSATRILNGNAKNLHCCFKGPGGASTVVGNLPQYFLLVPGRNRTMSAPTLVCWCSRESIAGTRSSRRASLTMATRSRRFDN